MAPSNLVPRKSAAFDALRRTNAAAVLAGQFHCLECQDGFIAYDRPTITATVSLIRQVRPALVFAHSPHDYLIDHEVTSALVRNATFFAGVPNLKTESFEPFRPVPHLYYADAIEGKDLFGVTSIRRLW